MKISFPYIGNYHIAFKMLLEEIGHEAIVPPKPSKRTLSLGVSHSPEYACLPFKILLGTYLESIDLGAKMLITSGGDGPCRAGYYGILHQKILQELGFDAQIIVFDSIYKKPHDFFQKLYKILKLSNASLSKFLKAFYLAWTKLKIIDEIELTAHMIRPKEIVKGTVSKELKKWLHELDYAKKIEEIQKIKKAALEALRKLPQKENYWPLKVGLVGEIYVVLEPFVNFNIIEKLGEMGVYAHRSISLSGWTKEKTFFDNHEKKIIKKAAKYLKEPIGGHGINSIGEAVLYAEEKYDGLIQLAPFSCIPEIVSKGILNKVSEDLNLPALTIFLDEQTGEAGLLTRLEAFVDLLRARQGKGVHAAV